MKETVLVTGTSSGLGMAIALYLAERGFHVYATMRDIKASGCIKKAAKDRNVSLSILPLDITKPMNIKKALEQIIAKSGGIFALINNAGIQVRGFFEDLTEEEVRAVFETNIFGTLGITRAVLPFMRKAKRGRLIFIGSVGGRVATICSSIYCATKFALEGFAESLYQEVRPLGISVSVIEPGIVSTELFGRNRRVGERVLDATSPFFQWYQNFESITDRCLASATLKPQDVARIVYKALIIKKPRLRYVVGQRAKLLVMGKRFFPWDQFERIYARKLWKCLSAE